MRKAAAFTLIELVVSASLMSLILVSAYLCLHSGISSRKLIEERMEAVQSARVAMGLVGADLRSACPLTKDVPFLGMQRMIGDLEADNLDFGTHNYTPRRPGEGDYCQVSYFLDKEPESGKFSLWRRRNPKIAIDPLAGGSREEIARGLRKLQFEYYDGFDWYSDWGDAEGRGKAQNSLRERPNLVGMPEAVRITMEFEIGSGSVKPKSDEAESGESTMEFQTVCRLNLAGVSQPKASGDSSSSTGGNTSGQTGQGAGEGARQ